MNLEVTSVSKRPEKLSDAASAIQVVTDDDIEQSGASSLPEALRLASNLEVAQIDSRQWAISARGFNDLFADKMLVMIDGRSVYTPLYAGVYWDVQNPMLEDIDRIEVISGPGATLWGDNAVNGVINITTKSARDTQGGILTAGVGTELDDFASVRYGGQVAPGVYCRVYGEYFDDGNTVRPNGSSDQDAWRMGQGGFRMDSYASPGSQFTLQGDVYAGATTEEGQDNVHMSGDNLLGRWTKALDGDDDLKIQLYYDHTTRNIPGSFSENLDTYDLDFQDHFRTGGGGQDVVWGGGCRIEGDAIVNSASEAFLPPDVTNVWFNTFAQDEFALAADSVHLTVGTKLEHNPYTGFELEPSVRATWTLGPESTLWSAVSRAVRTPSRIDTDLYEPAAPPYREEGGADVASEKLLAYELGFRVEPDPRLALGIATFYDDYTDLRSLDPLDPPRAFPVQVASDFTGDSAGAELTADWQVTPIWRLRAGYTELRVHTEPASGTIARGGNRSISLDPNHQASLRSALDLSRSWELDADLRYVGPIGNQALPGYAEMDARLGWRPGAGWEYSIVGQNLLHPEHAEFDAPGSRSEIPRSVFAKASWEF